VTPDDQACLALDLGGATTSAALLGRVDGRWRLLGAGSAPSAIAPEALIAMLGARLTEADPDVARALDAASLVDRWPRLVARTGRAPRMVVLAATERSLARFDVAARRAGWNVLAASAETTDPSMTALRCAATFRRAGRGHRSCGHRRAIGPGRPGRQSPPPPASPELTACCRAGWPNSTDSSARLPTTALPAARHEPHRHPAAGPAPSRDHLSRDPDAHHRGRADGRRSAG
jgi:hypothetical protein